MELILIRHGTTQGNLERRFIGLTDLPLLPAGEELARSVAPTLPPVDHIYRSPLLRCRQTADLLWPGVAHTVVDDLHETDFGPFEGKNHEELKDDPLYQAWISEDADLASLPVGETSLQVAERTARGLRWLLADAQARGFRRPAVVSHGGTMLALMLQFGRPERDYGGWMCGNCTGFRALVHPDPLELEVLEPVGGRTP